MEPLSRPAAAESPADRARAWVEWFGIGRLVATVLATLIVCGGAYWLVRTPPPPTEGALPYATTTAPSTVTGLGTLAREPEEETPVLVHVTGAVIEPGVYELPPGARVRDAVVAAGGPTADADWNALNLAAVVADASRVYVPLVGEVVAVEAPQGEASVAGPVDVNRATVDQLDQLPGIGPATAAAIVTERERNGPFAGVDDLDRVPGIGPAKLEALRDLVTT